MKIINCYLIIINIISFFIFALDKFLAIKHKNRVSEKNLLLISLIGGSIGSLVSMIIFRHKIRKPKFIILIPLFIIISLFLYTKIPLNK